MLFGSYAGSSTDKMGGAGSAEVLRTCMVGGARNARVVEAHTPCTYIL